MSRRGDGSIAEKERPCGSPKVSRRFGSCAHRPRLRGLSDRSSRADDQRVRFGIRPGRAGRGAARRHGHDHLTSRTQGNVLTTVTDSDGRFVLPDRPSRRLHAQGHAPGLQDGGADERDRERERQALDGVADPGGRRADRGSQRDRPRQRAADDERRTLVHAGERGAEEHRQQRAHALQLRDAGARRAVAEHRQHRDRRRSAASR